jgi:hypothetical protein
MARKLVTISVLVIATLSCSGSGDKGRGAGGDTLAVGDVDGSDALQADAADSDLCANVGCAAPPGCGETCTALCGCCGCTPGQGSCAVEAGAYVSYACDTGGSCISRIECGADTACAYVTPEVPVCAPAFTVGGTLNGAATLIQLFLSYQIADGTFRIDSLTDQDNGSFRFTASLPDGFGYGVAAMWPAGQRCDVINATGAIAGADVVDVEITCSSTSPCQATQIPSPHQCLANPPGCPAYFIPHDLSCNTDGSPSPDLACCEPTGE